MRTSKVFHKMLVNIIKTYRTVVAVCDKELLGKKFESGIFQLDVKESFYHGKDEPKSKEQVIELMKSFSNEDATFNIVGKKSVAAAVEAGIIDQEGVGEISGIPFALVLA